MKATIFMIFILFGISNIICQTIPENGTVKYDKNESKNIVNNSDLRFQSDSIKSTFLNDFKKKYFIKKDSTIIIESLIGKWTFKKAEETNGKEVDFGTPVDFEFKKNGIFSQIRLKDTIYGYWKFQKNDTGNLKLEYFEPQIGIRDKELIERLNLDKKSLELLTYSSNILLINFINEQKLKFISEISLNYSSKINEQFYKIVYLTYTKEK